MKKFYVTTPIYYVNAKPHIGNAYPTIAADVIARYYRGQGSDVHFLTGTAEHGTKMSDAANAANQTPQEFVDQNSAHFKSAWDKLNINYNDYIRTTETRHEEAVKKFFLKLKDSGQIYEDVYEGLYCVGHEAFIKEADLDEQGNCPDHAKPPETVKEKNWFFKLSDYSDLLKERITSGEFQINPTSRRNEVLSFIDQGLEDISISRPNVEWAIPLPWDETQTIYVWLDELFNYCSAIGYGADEEQFNKYWPADVHIVGKDIIKFHCIIWPALLEAIGLPWPKQVFAHGFFTIDGQKISKSLGNAIDPVELANQYGTDALRYFILRDIPFGNDGDFSHERFKDRYNADLANGLGNLVSRTLNMIEQFAPTFSPPARGGVSGGGSDDGVAVHIQALAFDKALESIWQAIAEADELIEQTKPWELAKVSPPARGGARGGGSTELQAVLTKLYTSLVSINTSLAPFLPDTHQILTKLLAARPIKKPAEPLFARQD